MKLCFAFDIVDGDKVENDIGAYGLIPNAPLIQYLLNRSSKSIPIISLSKAREQGTKSGYANIYSFRFAVFPKTILSAGVTENDWFGDSDRHRLFRQKIEQLASIDNLNLLIDHSWECLSPEQAEDLIKIFLRLRFPSERLIIISSNIRLLELSKLLRQYGTIVMGHWFWEAYVQSLANQTSFSDDNNNHLAALATDRLYLSLNRNPRPHRIAMCAFLLSRGYDKISHLSFGGEKALPPAQRDITALANIAKRRFADMNGPVLEGDIDNLISRGPIDLDVRFSPATESAKLATGAFESINTFYRNAKISIVTETIFSNSLLEVCLTEKIFKPIAYRHVFLVTASPGTLFELRRLGYETFGGIFDESYDEICDPKERLIEIFRVIDQLSKDWVDRGDEIFAPLQDILTHNWNNLMHSSDRRLMDLIASLDKRITERQFLQGEFGARNCDYVACASDLRDELVFASGGNGATCLVSGFSDPEPWGVWTVEPQATITAPIAFPSDLLLWLEFQTFARADGPSAGFSIDVQGQPVGNFRAPSARWGEVYECKFEIPGRLIQRKQLEITLKIENGPTSAELAPGRRPIGVGLRRMRLISTSPTRQPCDLATNFKQIPTPSPRPAPSDNGPM